MTDQTAQEPTMEEILASIRRIISEDEAPAETAAPVAEAPAPVAPEVPAPVEEDVLELTQSDLAPGIEGAFGDLDVSVVEPEPFPVAEPAPVYQPAPEPASVVETAALVDDSTAASAASAFAGLSAALKAPEPAADIAIGGGLTIDELARGLLRPLLKDWLDANLPGIVEEAVRKEVERIARNAG